VRPTSWHSSKGLAGFTTARRDSDFRSQPLAALHAYRAETVGSLAVMYASTV
jgi:hypothetical protein